MKAIHGHAVRGREMAVSSSLQMTDGNPPLRFTSREVATSFMPKDKSSGLERMLECQVRLQCSKARRRKPGGEEQNFEKQVFQQVRHKD